MSNSQPDPIDRLLLDRMQQAFPVVAEPWAALGEDLGLSASEVLARVRRLKEEGIIRQISPIFDTRTLGYTSMLVAAKVPEDRVDAAAAVVNEHPGVTHNYYRPHAFNLWFTLAVPPGASIEAHLEKLAERAGLDRVLPLPTVRLFKIGVKLRMGDEGEENESTEKPSAAPAAEPEPVALSDFDRRAVRVTQGQLPLEERPFDAMAEELGVTVEELLAWLKRMRESGAMRRFAAILRHRSAGFTANGMGVWQIPEEHIEEAGLIAAEFPECSHCYQRPTYPDWPYNLFTMVHARSREACQAVVDRMYERLAPLGAPKPMVLYSTKEYKKTRLRYFTEDFPSA